MDREAEDVLRGHSSIIRRRSYQLFSKGPGFFSHHHTYPDSLPGLTGSGIETVAHIKENGRIVIMFCAFEGPPKILRLHGTGQVIEMSHPDFDSMGKHFSERMGVRAYIRIDLTRISESCGYSIPLYKYEKDRDVLDKYIAAKGEDGLKTYRAAKNLQSIDGIGGLEE
jgi:hypothetical protein